MKDSCYMATKENLKYSQLTLYSLQPILQRSTHHIRVENYRCPI